MSRRRRDRGENPDDLLSELAGNDSGLPAASEIADAAYSSAIGHDDKFRALSRGREKIVRLSIEAIQPHVMQPRRAIPAAVRQYWTGQVDHDSMGRFFEQWLAEIRLERDGDPLPLDAYLRGEQTARAEALSDEDQLTQISDGRTGLKEAALMRIVELAASIHRDGLINPISVAENGRAYEIETGERRWLAFHLLNWHLGQETDEYEKIPARQVEAVSIWRQADENNARADLNAIGQARQFALLLMDALTERGEGFQPYEAFDHEMDFYAQVSDGNAYPVPYGMGEQFINAMGISSTGQLRHIRRLLRLPQIVWTVADDLNWSENFIQKQILVHADEEETLRRAIRQALKERYPDYLLDEYLHLLQAPAKSAASSKRPTFAALESSLLPRLEKQIESLSKKEREKAIDYLQDLLERLQS